MFVLIPIVFLTLYWNILFQLNQGVFSQGIPGQKNLGRGRSVKEKTNSALTKPVLKLQVGFILILSIKAVSLIYLKQLLMYFTD